MSELKKALMTSQDITGLEANKIISEMKDRVLDHGEDPEEVLYEEGLESDYIFDLLDF